VLVPAVVVLRALRGCALVAALEAEGRTSEGDVSRPGGGGWGTVDVECRARQRLTHRPRGSRRTAAV